MKLHKTSFHLNGFFKREEGSTDLENRSPGAPSFKNYDARVRIEFPGLSADMSEPQDR